ncbi:MAG: hypothetical protein RI958_1217 [Actinomycetota bacterium]|jgi:hypothetical protein
MTRSVRCERRPDRLGHAVGLPCFVLLARPEKPSKAVLATTRNHVNMKVRNALAHHVVVRDEGAVCVQCPRKSRRDPPNGDEQRRHLVIVQIGERGDMPTGHHEDMTLEKWGSVEERNRLLVGPHHIGVRSHRRHGTEDTVRHDHGSKSASLLARATGVGRASSSRRSVSTAGGERCGRTALGVPPRAATRLTTRRCSDRPSSAIERRSDLGFARR